MPFARVPGLCQLLAAGGFTVTEPLVRKSFCEEHLREITNSHAEVVSRLEKQLTEALNEVAILKAERAKCLDLMTDGRKWQDLMRQMKLTADDWACDAKDVRIPSDEFDDLIPRRLVGRKQVSDIASVPVDFVLETTELVYRVVVGEVQ